jgi:hypothetical protein
MALVADPQYLPAVVIALPAEIDMANAGLLPIYPSLSQALADAAEPGPPPRHE